MIPHPRHHGFRRSMPRGVRTRHTVFDSTMGSGNISSPMAVSPRAAPPRPPRDAGSDGAAPRRRMRRTASRMAAVRWVGIDTGCRRGAPSGTCRRATAGSPAPSRGAGRRRAWRASSCAAPWPAQARSLTEARARPRGRPDAFLGARHVEVHAPLVGADVETGDGRHGVQEEGRPRAARSARPPQRDTWSPSTSRCAPG